MVGDAVVELLEIADAVRSAGEIRAIEIAMTFGDRAPSRLVGLRLASIEESPEAARRLMAAIETVTDRGEYLSPDLGGSARTAEVTAAVIAALSAVNSTSSSRLAG
ncbi:hypothetical protein [Mesorhizobium sp. M2C.T.Ca.TU.002.02.1.1]|uniref:hypothetical protein n=1 Tax=Mesorhizobium sp. M2C.T.Ca.TU.002.02.1.1 TaxID=2496788 RepID=UPI0019CFA273|nr:hypothetical protein [Mesorhizobium sp. M2C.T.Ca.TU.002.02.1.1]